jgi:hypothetical protein
VTDLDTAVTDLRALGVAVTDPAGNRVELQQSPAG